MSAEAGKKDGAEMLEGDMVVPASDTTIVEGGVVREESRGKAGNSLEEPREEAWVYANDRSLIKLVRELETKRELIEKEQVRLVEGVVDTGMELEEGGGIADEINPVTAGMGSTDWGLRMEMEESGSLPLGQRTNENTEAIDTSDAKRAKMEMQEILGLVSSSDEGESPVSPAVVARRGRKGGEEG